MIAQSLRIEPMQPADWPAVRAIYLEGIATGDATFETAAPEWERWDASHLPACLPPRRPARWADRRLGRAQPGLRPPRLRRRRRGQRLRGGGSARAQGIGNALLAALVAESERARLWTLQAGIFPENVASLALHKACGFREVGRRERIGQMNGVWRDTVLMERRSKVVGV